MSRGTGGEALANLSPPSTTLANSRAAWDLFGSLRRLRRTGSVSVPALGHLRDKRRLCFGCFDLEQDDGGVVDPAACVGVIHHEVADLFERRVGSHALVDFEGVGRSGERAHGPPVVGGVDLAGSTWPARCGRR